MYKYIHQLRDILEDLEEFLAENMDVVDGPNGKPLPDREMQAHTRTETALVILEHLESELRNEKDK